jgi:hypothetical protein
MNRMQFYPDEKSIATDWISKSISSQVRRGHFIFAVAAKQQIFTTRSLIFYPGGSHWRDFYRGDSNAIELCTSHKQTGGSDAFERGADTRARFIVILSFVILTMRM